MTMRIELGQDLAAIVDPEDYARLSRYRYYAKRCRDKIYVARCGTSGPVKFYHSRRGRLEGQRNFVPLSHDILGVAPGTRVRHLNGDTLDCRRSNLRIEGGQSYHMRHVRRKPYAARIRVDGRRYFLGTWPSADWATEVCRLADAEARELRGKGYPAAHVRRRLDLAVGREV